MRKSLSILLAVLLFLGICGCRPASATPTLGFIHSSSQDAYTAALEESFRTAAEELGYSCIVLKPENNTVEAQISLIEDLIEQGVRGFVLNANQSEGLEDVLDKAKDAGISVVSVGRDTKGSQLYVQPSSTDLVGEALMEAVYDLSSGEGTFAVLSGEYSFSGIDIWVHCMGLAARDSKYQKLIWAKTSYRFDGTGSLEEMMALITQLQQEYPELEVICCPGPKTLMACSKAIEELDADLKVTGMYFLPTEMQELAGEGKPCPYFITWDSRNVGRCIAYALKALEDGATLQKGGIFTTQIGGYGLQNGYDDHLQIIAGPPVRCP